MTAEHAQSVVPDGDLQQSGRASLCELFFSQTTKDVDKWEQYLGIYERHLAQFVSAGRPVDLLEVGTQNGGSLELWSRLLPSGSRVTGLDIAPEVGDLSFDNPRITAHVVDATDAEAVNAILADRRFDIVIDDASHKSSHIISTFELLFHRLKPGGIFIVEDIHCSYQPAYEGGFRQHHTSIEWLKRLIDALNFDHVVMTEVPEGDRGSLQRYNRLLASVAFYDSVVVIERLTTPKVRPYRRIYSGMSATVVDPSTWMRTAAPSALKSMLFGLRTAARLDGELVEIAEERRRDIEDLRHELAAQAEIADDQLHVRRACASLRQELEGVRSELAFQTRLVQDLDEIRHRDLSTAEENTERLAAELAQSKAARAALQAEVDRYAEAAKLPPAIVPSTPGSPARSAPSARANLWTMITGLLRPSVAAVPLVSSSSSDRDEIIIRRAGLLGFDADWYVARCPPAAEFEGGPIRHYVRVGWRNGQDPHPRFDTRWYLSEHPDVRASDTNPLVHYLTHGRAEGRACHPVTGHWR